VNGRGIRRGAAGTTVRDDRLHGRTRQIAEIDILADPARLRELD
jgi:hypothetical protein